MEDRCLPSISIATQRPPSPRTRWQRAACSVLAAFGIAVALSGCVIEPWHPEHPHYHGY